MATRKQIIIGIAVVVFVPTIVTAGIAGYMAYDKHKTKKMREKYPSISSFEDFFIAAPYMQNKELFGYKMKGLKKIEGLDKKITLDELKKIYSAGQSGPAGLTNEQAADVLGILKKAHG